MGGNTSEWMCRGCPFCEGTTDGNAERDNELLHRRRDASVEGQMVQGETARDRWTKDNWIGYAEAYREISEARGEKTSVGEAASKASSKREKLRIAVAYFTGAALGASVMWVWWKLWMLATLRPAFWV